MKLASFDIFDTTLIRKCGVPENIFYLLSKQIYPDNEALQNSFYLWRRRAESNAMTNLQNPYLTLEEIYTEFDSLSFPGRNADELMQLELELEMQNLIANTAIKNLIQQKKQAGYTICFISDMYLSSRILKDKLIEQECATPEDMVFVSCEMKASKNHNGDLYQCVRNQLSGITHWEHYGDNRCGDYKRAFRQGVKGILVKTDYTETERQILNFARYYPHPSELSILAGFQRAARLSAGKLDADHENAADFVASLYIPYVKYILDKSKEQNIKRLYFLSRDGYILQQIAEVFHTDYPEIEFKYLFVSRYSLLLPGLYTMDREEVLESFGKNSFYQAYFSVNEIFYYLRISPQEIGDIFQEYINFDYVSTKEEEDRLFELLQHPTVKSKILSNASAERQKLLCYFRQEGLLEKEKWATVDVGWVGTSRLTINRILEKEGLAQQSGFYCGCSATLLPPRYGECYCFYSSELTESRIPELLEHYYSASPYPSTKGYVYAEDQSVKPLFKDTKSTQSQDIINANITIVCHIASMIKQHNWISFETAMRMWGGFFLRSFIEVSCHIDYSTFTKLGVFEDGMRRVKFVRKISIWNLFKYLFKGKIRNLLYPRQSVYYSFHKKFYKPENSFYEKQKEFFNNTLFTIIMKIKHYNSWK